MRTNPANTLRETSPKTWTPIIRFDRLWKLSLFRHTVATLMLDNVSDIRFIQQMLGHVSIGTTEIYTHVSIVKLKQIHEVIYPALHQKQDAEAEPDATEEELLSTLEAEAEADEEKISC